VAHGGKEAELAVEAVVEVAGEPYLLHCRGVAGE
jgi:hypothetical protein